MSTVLNELAAPQDAANNDNAMEITRIWCIRGEQQFVLASDVWDDPAAWGLLLADLARQVAKSYAESSPQVSERTALERVKEGFDIEWEHPTGQ